jgi:hypothetical protein
MTSRDTVGLGGLFFFWRLTGGRFLGAVAEDTLDALMELALVFVGHIQVLYYVSKILLEL